MTTSNTAANLPRTSALARLAILTGLADPARHSNADIVAKRWPTIGDAQRQLLTTIGPRAAAVESIDMPASTAAGQLFTGIAQQTLLGQLRVLADVQLRAAFGTFAAGEPTGTIHRPGVAIPLMELDFSRVNLEPIVASALVVVSRELLEDGNAEGGLNDLLLRAVSKAADGEFITRALDGAAATASGASTPWQVRTQVAQMVSALVAAGANARLITLAASPATLVLLACAPDAMGNSAFPTVTVNGGSLCGLPLVSSSGAPDGQIVAVAGDAVLRAPGSVDVRHAVAGRMEFNDAPTGDAEPGVTPVAQSAKRVDLFSTNCAALRVLFTFGADFTRDTRAAFIDGIDAIAGSTA